MKVFSECSRSLVLYQCVEPVLYCSIVALLLGASINMTVSLLYELSIEKRSIKSLSEKVSNSIIFLLTIAPRRRYDWRAGQGSCR